MTFNEYLAIKDQVDWLLLGHPEFADELSPAQKEVLRDAILYDVVDSEYPPSLALYFSERILPDCSLIKGLVQVASLLYEVSGMGRFSDDFPAVVSQYGS